MIASHRFAARLCTRVAVGRREDATDSPIQPLWSRIASLMSPERMSRREGLSSHARTRSMATVSLR